MVSIQLSETKLQTLVRESVKEALKTEFMKLRALLVPQISDAEQADIEQRYKKPSRRAAVIHRMEL